MPGGEAVSLTAQTAASFATLQSAQTGNANGSVFSLAGYKTAYLWVTEANVGTATLTVQGSFDNATWFGLWAAPTGANGRTFAATFSITQNSKTYLVIQDVAPFIRAVTSANSGNVSVGLYATPI